MHIKVSVIIPAYNCETTIKKCVQSVLKQTENNIEIILIDDGSTDSTGRICDSLRLIDYRIKVLHTDNKGLSSARNSGIKNAHGDYLLFVDADDWIEKEMINDMLVAITSFSADMCVCGKIIESKKSIVNKPAVKETCVYTEDIPYRILNGQLSFVVWNKLWRKELFSEDCLFPANRVYEDIVTVWQIALKCKSAVCVPKCYYHYMQYKDSITHSINLQTLYDRWLANKEIYDYCTEVNNEKINEACIYQVKRRCLKSAASFWLNYCNAPVNQQKCFKTKIDEIREFTKGTIEEVKLNKKTTIVLETCINYNRFIIYLLGRIYTCYRMLKGRMLLNK